MATPKKQQRRQKQEPLGHDRKNGNKKRRNMPKILTRGNIIFILSPVDANSDVKLPWRMVITILLVFLGGVGIAMTHAQITNMETRIIQSRRVLLAYQEANSALEAQVLDRHTTDEIERIARYRLGMELPDPSQIIDIYVPRRDTVVLNIDEYALPRENFFWRDIVGFMSGLITRMLGGV